MLFTSLATVVAAASLASAATIERRQPPPCKTYRTGYLAAEVGTSWNAFTLNDQQQVAYYGDGREALYVEFQKCPDLQDRGPGQNTETNGVLYVPKYKKCIAITNQGDATGPYWTSLEDCDQTYPFRWLIRHDVDDRLYWYGMTDEEGTTPQGGCGLLGYKSYTQGVPVTTHATHQIEVTCGGFPGHGFRIAKAPHPTPPPDCETIRKGYLSATVDGNLKKFTLNSQNQLAYLGNGQHPIDVEFRRCFSLNGRPGPGKPSTDILGQIYVPSKGKCLSITNYQDSHHSPWYTTLSNCGTSTQFTFALRNYQQIQDGIYWNPGGIYNVNGCGLLGYESDNHGKPKTHSNHQAAFTCGYPGHPLKIWAH